MSALANSSARVQRSYDLLQTLHDLNTALTDTETNQRGFLLTQDPSYLSQYNTAIAQIRLAMIELRRLSSGEPETRTAIDCPGGTRRRQAGRSAAIAAPCAGRCPWHSAMANEVQGKGKYLMDAFRRNSAALENIQRQLLDRATSHRKRKRGSSAKRCS